MSFFSFSLQCIFIPFTPFHPLNSYFFLECLLKHFFIFNSGFTVLLVCYHSIAYPTRTCTIVPWLISLFLSSKRQQRFWRKTQNLIHIWSSINICLIHDEFGLHRNLCSGIIVLSVLTKNLLVQNLIPNKFKMVSICFFSQNRTKSMTYWWFFQDMFLAEISNALLFVWQLNLALKLLLSRAKL